MHACAHQSKKAREKVGGWCFNSRGLIVGGSFSKRDQQQNQHAPKKKNGVGHTLNEMRHTRLTE
jgi:hypothetical protein